MNPPLKAQLLYGIPRDVVCDDYGRLIEQITFLDDQGRFCIDEKAWQKINQIKTDPPLRGSIQLPSTRASNLKRRPRSTRRGA